MKKENQLCIECHKRPILVQIRRLCSTCYQRYRRSSTFQKLPTKDIIRQNLVDNYGEEILEDFDLLFKRPFWTLTELGKKYNFSRERARQLFTELYGIPFRLVQKEKTKALKQELRKWDRAKCDPRQKALTYKESNVKIGADGETLVLEKCKELGFSYKYMPIGSVIDFRINGYLVEIKCATKYGPTNKSGPGYYRFQLKPQQKQKADFVICCVWPTQTCYIIPAEAIGCEKIYIRAYKSTHPNAGTNHADHKEAWHLLQPITPQPQEAPC